jgi:hypothetical protein
MTDTGSNTEKQVPTSPEIRAPTIHGSEDLGQQVRALPAAPTTAPRHLRKAAKKLV